jgi:hypothetical protein
MFNYCRFGGWVFGGELSRQTDIDRSLAETASETDGDARDRPTDRRTDADRPSVRGWRLEPSWRLERRGTYVLY